MFNISDFVPCWILMVPFAWTDMMVQGSLSYGLSVLRRILSLCSSTLSPGWLSHTSTVFPVRVVIFLFLSVFPNFWTVSEERDVKQHAPFKNCLTWWGFKYCVVGRAKGPCCMCEKVSYVTLVDCVSHIYDVSHAEHCRDCLMHPLEYCIHLWVFDAGWLTLQTLWITEGHKVKFEFTSVVIDNVLTM